MDKKMKDPLKEIESFYKIADKRMRELKNPEI